MVEKRENRLEVENMEDGGRLGYLVRPGAEA